MLPNKTLDFLSEFLFLDRLSRIFYKESRKFCFYLSDFRILGPVLLSMNSLEWSGQ